MSITKGQLKSIVKECLIEILSEGMGSSTGSTINEASKKPSASSVSSSNPHVSTVMRQNASRIKMQQSASIKEAIKREAGGNSVMADILADTAARTLPVMMENDRTKQPVSMGAAESIVASHDPEELFGEETTSKWADLAFMGMPKK